MASGLATIMLAVVDLLEATFHPLRVSRKWLMSTCWQNTVKGGYLVLWILVVFRMFTPPALASFQRAHQGSGD